MRKVLIIDDEPSVAAFMAALVEVELGFAPIIAYDEESALEAISGFDYALIISDTLSFRPHLTPEKGGDRWQWLDQLQKHLTIRQAKIPVLVMTAYPREIYRDYSSHGLKGFIAKPFNLEDTVKEILRALSETSDSNNQEPQVHLTSLLARKAAAALRLEQGFTTSLAM
jgi:DNA-binding NtrC family response regulator